MVGGDVEGEEDEEDALDAYMKSLDALSFYSSILRLISSMTYIFKGVVLCTSDLL